MGMKKIILLLVGIFMTMMCLGGIFTLSILLQYADFQQGKAVVIIIFLLMITGFGLAAFKCFKSAFNKEKASHNSNTTNIPVAEMFAQPSSGMHLERDAVSLSSIPEKEFEEPQRITPEYIETHNMIYRVDGEPITDEEVPYLVQATQKEAIAKWKISDIIHLIQESYQIMYETVNPETLCIRYESASSKVEELNYYYHQGYYTDIDKISQYTEMFSDENYFKLILCCYQKYVDRANRELKTKKGVEKRIDKFWNVIQNNVDPEMYIRLRQR